MDVLCTELTLRFPFSFCLAFTFQKSQRQQGIWYSTTSSVLLFFLADFLFFFSFIFITDDFQYIYVKTESTWNEPI